jgi:SagB-type dehydrogenase family enzyme
METYDEYRHFLKADLWQQTDLSDTGESQGQPLPPIGKDDPPGTPLLELVPPAQIKLGQLPLLEAITRRRSRRKYAPRTFTLEELSFLLWATQGVQHVYSGGSYILRTVPSGGARHPFETYLLVNRVEAISAGIYHYQAFAHRLARLAEGPLDPERLTRATSHDFSGEAAVVFAWAVLPGRAEWRYGPLSHKMIAIEAGHICQNLYLACEAIGAGACAIGGYHQAEMDLLLGLDGEDEFTVYVATTGKLG